MIQYFSIHSVNKNTPRIDRSQLCVPLPIYWKPIGYPKMASFNPESALPSRNNNRKDISEVNRTENYPPLFHADGNLELRFN